MEMIESLVADERSARIALAVAVEPGDVTTATVTAAVGASETLRLLTSTDAVPGVETEAAALWRNLAAPGLRPQAVQQVMDATQRHGLHVSIPGDPEWPEGFTSGGVTPPLALWVLGEADILRVAVQRLVALTGSRAASAYGGFVAAELATGAAERGGIVVGGGAYGIEAAAHRGALNAGGKTIAVLAGGLDKPYPAGNQPLFERIASNGVLLSEIPPGCAPTRLRFVQRARLLAALSDTSIIVEAGVRSGSLLVAARAAAFGRDVGAVPGPITSFIYGLSSVWAVFLQRSPVNDVKDGVGNRLCKTVEGLDRIEAPGLCAVDRTAWRAPLLRTNEGISPGCGSCVPRESSPAADVTGLVVGGCGVARAPYVDLSERLGAVVGGVRVVAVVVVSHREARSCRVILGVAHERVRVPVQPCPEVDGGVHRTVRVADRAGGQVVRDDRQVPGVEVKPD